MKRFLFLLLPFGVVAGGFAADTKAPKAPKQPDDLKTAVGDGYRGIWYMNQALKNEYVYKYSGGFATYPQQHVPIAVYSAKANKTFFTYAGKTDDSDHLVNMVAYYDHATGEVPRPVVLVERKTNDAHFNGTLALDDAGHVYVFCNVHGAGGGKAQVFRSREPNSIDAFDIVREENFSYSQAWSVEGQGILWLHTRYQGNRRPTFFSTIGLDGTTFSEPKPIADIEQGSYHVSWSDGKRVATAFDFHPKQGGLNARTNLHYLETRDFGRTWTTVAGEKVALPLTDVKNAALVRDFQREGLLVYLKDIAFDAGGHPVVLYITSHGYASGPNSGPRQWNVARWTGTEWVYTSMMPADHNYDHGSLYIEPDGAWRLIAPTEPGPQPHTTGGQITIHTSKDMGLGWSKVKTLDVPAGRNQTYVRRPLNARPEFYALWADGDPLKPSESDLYFCDQSGNQFCLPRMINGEHGKPEPVPPR